MFLLPAFAVYGLIYSLAPNATDYLAQVTLVVTMTVREFELASYVYNHHSTDLIKFSDYALTEVERSLRQYSAADAALYSAPIGAYLWDSSPSLQHYTHAAESYAHMVSDIARTAASQVVHTSLGLGTSTSPLVPAPLTESIFDPIYNIPPVAHEPLRPIFGPEWEWTPRDLVVWVPPPACPAPILTSDMSTASGIGKCGLGPERYMPMDVAAFPLPPLPAPGSYDLFDTLEALDMLRSPAAPYSPQSADPSGILGWLSMALATVYLVRITWCYFKALVLFGPVGDVLCRRFFSNFNECEEEYGVNMVSASTQNCLDICDPSRDLNTSGSILSPVFIELPPTQIVTLKVVPDTAHQPNPTLDAESAKAPVALALGDRSETTVEERPEVAVELPAEIVIQEATREARQNKIKPRARKVVKRGIKTPIQVAAEISQRVAHGEPVDCQLRPHTPERLFVGVQEDIIESTRKLAADLARQRLEDRHRDRTQRAADRATPPVTIARVVPGASGKHADREGRNGEGRRVEGRNGGDRSGEADGDKGRNSSGRTKEGEGRILEGGSMRESGRYVEDGAVGGRRWAGKDAGMFHVGFFGGILVLEGAGLKGGRSRGK
ncbi:hypothetical protein BDV93DRAFT_596198 [Ceratobasidium sp. AG-I]|nr:hypothetical protein BDV93DRAFT_596198 [Ceratobasidium sp. AG-I]